MTLFKYPARILNFGISQFHAQIQKDPQLN